MIQLFIYNPNSFGGNYDYSLQIVRAYNDHPGVENCVALYPVNAPLQHSEIHRKALIRDESGYQSKWLKKLFFIYRSVFNPLILLKIVRQHPGSCVIFNDFDQLSAPFWGPLFNLFKRKNTFGVILHDPDRDRYFPSVQLSRFTMSAVMRLMDVAFYHEVLPERSYYSINNTKFVKVPHGIYPLPGTDFTFKKELLAACGGKKVLSIIGNVRPEKNYELIIDALAGLDVILIVAGKPASSSVPVEAYKEQAASKGVDVHWVLRYLAPAELSAVIEISNTLLLYYAPSFTSQSGILNLVAPFRKDVIIADTPSALKTVAMQFGLGRIVKANDKEDFRSAVLSEKSSSGEAWTAYLEYASWESHSNIVVNGLTLEE